MAGLDAIVCRGLTALVVWRGALAYVGDVDEGGEGSRYRFGVWDAT